MLMITESPYTDIPINVLKGETYSFEEQYLNIRKKEHRIYTNDEVVLLPDISPEHIHYKEWRVRKRSCKRLVSYLKKKNKPLKIVEIGCGNGWLSARLADLSNTKVTGLDINLTELKQAIQVFDKPNLSYVYGDIDELNTSACDIMVFAAAIQYFPSLKQIVTNALSLLNTGGEIHILDSHFYKDHEANNALKRTLTYYEQLGYPKMADHYFHHRITELEEFNYKVLNWKKLILNKLPGRIDPFPWIRIIK